MRILSIVVPLIGIFMFGGAALHRRSWRVDLTPTERYSLSERTAEVLADLPPGSRVIAFLRSQDPRNARLHDLVRQIGAASSGVRTEVLDVNRAPVLARDFGVRGVAFVILVGDRHRVVSNPSEERIASAVTSLLREDVSVVGWVVGHGEGDPQSAERRTGFGALRRALELENRTVRPVALGRSGVPEDVDILMVVGPREEYLADEIQALRAFADGGGRMLVLLGAREAGRLGTFISSYGVVLDDDVVVDPSARLYGGESSTIRLNLDQRTHPIVRPLAAPPLFAWPRSVRFRSGADGMRGTEFLFGSNASFAAPAQAVAREARVGFVPGRDRRGPISMGVQVEAADAGARTAPRMVVLGSAEFANNFFLDFLGNRDLVLNAVAWLATDDTSVSHRRPTQRPGVNQFFVSDAQGRYVFWVAVVVQPTLIGLVGLALGLWRRRR